MSEPSTSLIETDGLISALDASHRPPYRGIRRCSARPDETDRSSRDPSQKFRGVALDRIGSSLTTVSRLSYGDANQSRNRPVRLAQRHGIGVQTMMTVKCANVRNTFARTSGRIDRYKPRRPSTEMVIVSTTATLQMMATILDGRGVGLWVLREVREGAGTAPPHLFRIFALAKSVVLCPSGRVCWRVGEPCHERNDDDDARGSTEAGARF
jgi:hypothetical protein